MTVGGRDRLSSLSATPYVATLVLTAVLSAYLNYVKDRLDPQGYSLFGQPPGVYIPFLLFPVTVALWLMCVRHAPRGIWTSVFLVGLVASWLVHFALIRVHGDLYVYAVWLFIPIVVMLFLKPPTWDSAFAALRLLAWLAGSILALTYVLEKLGALPRFNVADPDLVEYFEDRYLLPLNDLLGIDGRWDGPFGYNSKTAFMCAIIIVIAVSAKSRFRWFLLAIGSLGLLMTGSRAGLLALVAGLFTLACLTQSGPLAHIPRTMRVIVGGVGVAVVGGALYFMGSLGASGRLGEGGLWDVFLDLWRTSVWIGIGQQGLWAAPDRVSWMDPGWMDAHSIYIQELTKFGVVGFAATFAVLAIGVGIALAAGLKGQPLPLALIVVYLMAGATDLLHDGWQSMGTVVTMLVISVLGASAWLNQPTSTSSTPAPRAAVSP